MDLLQINLSHGCQRGGRQGTLGKDREMSLQTIPPDCKANLDLPPTWKLKRIDQICVSILTEGMCLHQPVTVLSPKQPAPEPVCSARDNLQCPRGLFHRPNKIDNCYKMVQTTAKSKKAAHSSDNFLLPHTLFSNLIGLVPGLRFKSISLFLHQECSTVLLDQMLRLKQV